MPRNILILLLCCTWIVFGGGHFISKGDFPDTTELKVIPDKNIFVLPNEYVTVSLNVEYRNDTKCTIKNSKMVENNKFTRVGACGFRGRGDDFGKFEWEIIEETKLFYKYAGRFTVETRNKPQITRIHFYIDNEDEPPVIPTDIYDREYCKIIMPKNNYVENGKKLTNSGYVIEKKYEHSGDWIVEYYNGNNTKKKIYDVIFEDKIIPNMNVSNEKNSTYSGFKFQCSINFDRITQCSFEGPSGLIINEGVAHQNDRFDFEVIGKEKNPDTQHSTCILTIHNVTTEEQGLWKCSLRDETQTANGTMNIEPPKQLTVEVFQKIGTEFDISCTDNDGYGICDMKPPKGGFTRKNVPKPHNSLETTNDHEQCITKIESANKTLDGNWICNVNSQNMEYERTFIVRVTEDFALADSKYEIIDGNDQIILEARPFPTDENRMKNVTGCRWTHPVDGNYLSYDSYYTITNENNVCRLVIKYPQEYDKGSWSCLIELKSSNGAWDKFIAFVDVNELEIYSMLWWYILYGLITALIITAIILFVWWDLVFQSKTAVLNKDNKPHEKHFKEYNYGNLNRTKKQSSNENESSI